MYKRLILTLVLCLSLTALAQATGPIAYYPFDGDTDDYSGNGKDGVFWSGGSSTATPTYVAGKSFQAIKLNAFDSYDTDGVGSTRIYQGVILPDESFFDFTAGITVAAWYKFNSVMSVGDQGAFAAMVTKSRANDTWCTQSNFNTGAQRMGWRLGRAADSMSTMSVRPGTTDDKIHLGVDDEDNPAWDTWYHIVTTYSSDTGEATIYINSQYSTSLTKTAADQSLGDRANLNLAASIGIYANSDYTPGGTGSSSDYSHDGLIDDVGIFDAALTAEQITSLYAAGSIAKTPFMSMNVVESDGSTDVWEGGSAGPFSDSYTVSLRKLPDGSDTVGVTMIYDANQITVNPNSIVLGNGSGSDPNSKVITVTVIDDAVSEGDHTRTIQHYMSSGDDPNYNFGVQTDWNVVVYIGDNDFFSVVIEKVNPTDPFELWEGGPGANFGWTGKGYAHSNWEPNEFYAVKLGAVPTGTVTVTISSDDGEAYGVSSLTFTTADWYTTQLAELRATNDETTFDGFIDHSDIKFLASGGGFDDANTTIEDADIFDGYYVEDILGTDQSLVTEGVYLSNIGDGSGSAGITLWGGYNENTGDQHQPAYAAGWQGKFKVTEANKMVKVTSRFGLAEGLGVTSDYVHEVVLLLDGTRCGDPGTIDPNNNLCLLETNQPEHGASNLTDDWHDSVRYIPILSNADPNHTITLGFWCSGYYNPGEPGDTTSKNTWTGLSMQHFMLEVMDTDEIGIMETLSARLPGEDPVPSTYVKEQGTTTDKYSVVLTKVPAGNVTVTVSPDPNVSVDKPSLTFTTANWYVAQTVTVTAVDDANNDLDPNAVYITHSASGYTNVDLPVFVADNDNRGVTINPTTLAVSETGTTTDDYTVVLTGAPYGGDAVLSLSYDTTEITVNPTALTFTSTDWMNAQTVTVTAVNDEDFESEIGDTHPATISGSFAGGLYNSITPSNVTVNITDNEKYCGMPGTPYMESDISGPDGQPDCYIDLYDLMKIAELWLTNIDPTP